MEIIVSAVKDTWKQETPGQQLVACNQNVLGWIFVLEDAIKKGRDLKDVLSRALPSMQKSAEDVNELHHWMKDQW